MIALIASALLGLYVFVPYIFFHRASSLFIRLKKFQRTKTEEVVAGGIVAGLPFAATFLLLSFGWICGSFVPSPLARSPPPKKFFFPPRFPASLPRPRFPHPCPTPS